MLIRTLVPIAYKLLIKDFANKKKVPFLKPHTNNLKHMEPHKEPHMKLPKNP